MHYQRHNPLRFLAALVAVAALAGCASGPDVRGDYDRAADFSKYKTYNFLSESGTNGTEFKSIAQQMMQQAASREMESRGYVKAQDPDLLINFKGKLEEKTDIQSTPAPYYGPSYGYRGWYGAPYGAYGYGGTEITTRRYNVGTLVMDVIDREKRVAVFQGGFEGVVSKKMMEDKEGTLNNAVAAIFSKYPFVAGQGTPVAPADPKK
ncbi:MAG: DUF4136 domain-containing protein [Gammaproteobacteria bacterium]|nr:DUF4136 domain-containing protein [Gammaproteobacteria bacterium]